MEQLFIQRIIIKYLLVDELVDIKFKWSTGVGFPEIHAIDPGVYVLTYTEVYASGIISSIIQTFSTTDRNVIIDPVVKVYYFWLSEDATPIVDVEKPEFDCKTIKVYALETPWYELYLRKQGLVFTADDVIKGNVGSNGGRHLRNFQIDLVRGPFFLIIIGKNKK